LLDTEAKLALIERLVEAGVQRLEVASFVNPKRVPQMADADAVIARPAASRGRELYRLGIERTGARACAGFGRRTDSTCAAVTTDSFCLRNQGKTSADMLELIASLTRRAQDAGRYFGVYDCRVVRLPLRGAKSRPPPWSRSPSACTAWASTSIALADTIGVAVPSDVKRLVEAVRPRIGATPLRMHFHNTRGTGIGNVYAAVESGVRIIDASCGGVGGCPFAPGATGNVGTEDVLYLLHRMGYTTGIDIAKVVATSKWLEGPLAAPMQASMTRASMFPPPRAA
jgi:hydroxymethylglutaryl-CoA lyase